MNAKPAAPRLGRGLAALMGEPHAASLAEAGGQLLAVSLLEPSPFQPRIDMDDDALEELAQSIRQRGVLQPILVRPNPADPARYQIIAGERRWRAAQKAGLHEVPTLVRALSDGDAMAAALVENLQRQDLDALEEADGYRRLIEEFGITQEQLGNAVGKSRSHVTNTLRLLGLPPGVRAELRRGRISAGHARALLAHPAPEEALLSVLTRGLNVRQTENMVQTALTQALHGAGANRAAPERSPEIAALEKELAEHLGLRVEIAGRGTSGTLRVHYRSLDQLDGVLQLLRNGK